MHFGMTGMIQVSSTTTVLANKQLRGGEPTWYRRKYNLGETVDAWPPKVGKGRASEADGQFCKLCAVTLQR